MSRHADPEPAIVKAVKSGKTLQALADRYQLTREPVRQICAAAGVQGQGRASKAPDPATPNKRAAPRGNS